MSHLPTSLSLFPLMNTRSTEQTLSPSHSHRLLPVCAAAASCSLFLALVGWWPRVCWKRYNPWPRCKWAELFPVFTERENEIEKETAELTEGLHTLLFCGHDNLFMPSPSLPPSFSLFFSTLGGHMVSHTTMWSFCIHPNQCVHVYLTHFVVIFAYGLRTNIIPGQCSSTGSSRGSVHLSRNRQKHYMANFGNSI